MKVGKEAQQGAKNPRRKQTCAVRHTWSAYVDSTYESRQVYHTVDRRKSLAGVIYGHPSIARKPLDNEC